MKVPGVLNLKGQETGKGELQWDSTMIELLLLSFLLSEEYF